MVAETSFSIHKLMCEELHLCEYNQPQGQVRHATYRQAHASQTRYFQSIKAFLTDFTYQAFAIG